MSVIPSLIYRFNVSQSKIPESYLVDIDKLILRFIWRSEGPRAANTLLKEKNKVVGLMLTDLKTYYKATVIKTVWDWQRNRQIDQWSKIESPEIDTHKHSQQIIDSGVEAVQGSKDGPSTNGAGTTGCPHAKNLIWTQTTLPFTRLNANWVININVRHKAMKLLEDSVGEN